MKRVEVWLPASQLRPGDQLQAYATPLDANGEVVETAPVVWRSLHPTVLAVSPYGLVTGLAPGSGTLRATAEGVHGSREIVLVNPPVASIFVNADTLRLALPGGVSPLSASPLDADGFPIVGEPLEWTSSATRIATVSPTGEVRAVAVGTAMVTVATQGVERAVVVIVEALATATSPVISSVAPVVALPGSTLIVNGSGFSGNLAANTVLIDGTPVPVTAASATQLVLSLPAAAAFPCEPTRVVALQVNAPGGIGTAPVTLQVATSRDLAVGQSVILTSSAEARCNEFTPAAGRYVVTVPNAGRALGAGAIALSVRGVAPPMAGGGTGASLVVAGRNATALREWAARGPRGVPGNRQARSRAAAHHRLLEANRRIAGRVGAAALRSASPAAALEAGTTVSLRFPSLGQESFCSSFTPIGARVVYAGARVAILEDTLPELGGLPTLTGQQDALIAQLGAELDAVGWPVLQVFGDPLVMDSRLDADGRVRIVLTPRMNSVLGGTVLAAVVNCDFYPRTQYASSNTGEYVYAQVPTVAAGGFGPGTRERWLHEMRATLLHELKHVTSFAERIVRNHPREETWLEEATARHAEELYARAIFGTQRDGDHDVTATLRCEILAGDPLAPECAGTPRAMRPHVEGLWEFLAAPAARTPLGPATAAGDFSFYGSAWALTRWLLDQEALAEPSFFTSLTTSSQSGVTNLAARSGRSWDEVLPEWSLAMLTDGRVSPPPASPRLRFPSWDLASLFHGLCELAGPCAPGGPASPFDRPHPWQPVQLEAGTFLIEAPVVEPGGFTAFELVATTPGLRQLLELRGYRGAPLPGAVRLGILRVE